MVAIAVRFIGAEILGGEAIRQFHPEVLVRPPGCGDGRSFHRGVLCRDQGEGGRARRAGAAGEGDGRWRRERVGAVEVGVGHACRRGRRRQGVIGPQAAFSPYRVGGNTEIERQPQFLALLQCAAQGYGEALPAAVLGNVAVRRGDARRSRVVVFHHHGDRTRTRVDLVARVRYQRDRQFAVGFVDGVVVEEYFRKPEATGSKRFSTDTPRCDIAPLLGHIDIHRQVIENRSLRASRGVIGIPAARSLCTQ